MTPESVLGLEAGEAEEKLRSAGYEVVRCEYESKRGVECADSERVIRVRAAGNNVIEITVSRFKTRV
ncbi:MAG: hypothetical protein ACM3S4_01950 [Burkholderiales bacterium]